MPADGYLNFNTKVDTDGFEKGIKNVESSAKGFGTTLDKLGGKIKAAFSVAAVAVFGKAAIESAAEVKAAGSQFSQTFGNMADKAEAAISRVAGPADILETRLQSAATSMFAFAKTAKMETSTAMTFMEDALQTAADSAAYYDRSLEDTTETLRSFLKGNYANDAALGLSATEATRNAKAMEMYGKTFNSLTEAQKQLALLEMVKDANRLSGAMGQAAREADGWENVTGNLTEAWRQLMAAVGQPLLRLAVPVVQQMTNALTQMATWANNAYLALAKVFGWQKQQTTAINAATDAQDGLTAAVEATEEAQEGALAGFDEIEVLASSAAESAQTSGGVTAAGGEESSVRALDIDSTAADELAGKLSNLKQWLDLTFGPAIAFIGEQLKNAFGKIDFETIKSGISNFLTSAKAQVSTVFSDLSTLSAPIAKWAQKDLPSFFSSGWRAISTTVMGLLDTFDMVFSDIWSMVVMPFLGTFFESILPMATQFGTELFDTWVVLFGELKTAFDTFWVDAVQPVLSFVAKAWDDLWMSIKGAWNKWGKPIFENLRTAIKKFSELWDNQWNKIIKPIWDHFMEVVDRLWTAHLKPFVDKFLNFVGTVVDGALRIYNEFIAPIVKWFQDVVGPVIVEEVNFWVDVIGILVGAVIDTVSAVIDWLTHIVDFIVGVFTGDWDEAWEALKLSFQSLWDQIAAVVKGAINVIIRFINRMISKCVDGVNNAIGLLNKISFDVPDWVPGIGGQEWGVNIPYIDAPQIPYLATGAVIPPNREFLAVLGDQTSGTNIETPLETMIDAFRTAMREYGGTGGSTTVILQVDKRELGRAVVELGRKEERRIGTRLVTS